MRWCQTSFRSVQFAGHPVFHRYVSSSRLATGYLRRVADVFCGPAFSFPEAHDASLDNNEEVHHVQFDEAFSAAGVH